MSGSQQMPSIACKLRLRSSACQLVRAGVSSEGDAADVVLKACQLLFCHGFSCVSGKPCLCRAWQLAHLTECAQKIMRLLMLHTVPYCLPERCKGPAAGGMHRGAVCNITPVEHLAILTGQAEELVLWLQGTLASIVCTQGASATWGHMPAGRAKHCFTW